MRLTAGRGGPRPAPRGTKRRGAEHDELVIGPFRNRAAVRATVAFLEHDYPIRHCPRPLDARPCQRGTSDRCLAPCTAHLEAILAHDRLVTGLLLWLTGSDLPEAPDPLRTPEEVGEHIVKIRRAYAALAAARRLHFAGLWRLAQDGASPSVRLNLVWGGELIVCMTLRSQTLERQLDEALAALDAHARRRPTRPRATSRTTLVAVPQMELDCLLAVGRWSQETDHADHALVPIHPAEPHALQTGAGQHRSGGPCAPR